MFSYMVMTLEKNRAEFEGLGGVETCESGMPQGFSVSWGKRKWSTIDANGNTTKDQNYTYTWDVANRLVGLTFINPQPTTMTNNLTFSYDGKGRRVGIIESHGSTVLTSKTFLWCDGKLCEERDSTGHTVNKQFYAYGEQIGGNNYYYTRDHLGSVREMTDSSGTVQANYDYDAWGRQTVLNQAVTADFGYDHYYENSTTKLYLTWHRADDPEKGRWLNRDPLGERLEFNLYSYVNNETMVKTDSSGLCGLTPDVSFPTFRYGSNHFGSACNELNTCLLLSSGSGSTYSISYDQYGTSETGINLHPITKSFRSCVPCNNDSLIFCGQIYLDLMMSSCLGDPSCEYIASLNARSYMQYRTLYCMGIKNVGFGSTTTVRN